MTGAAVQRTKIPVSALMIKSTTAGQPGCGIQAHDLRADDGARA
jgi:hypothetical protein